MTETPRARVARLHGEAARRIILDALGPAGEPAANAFAAAITRSAASSMSTVHLAALSGLTDAEVVAQVRPAMEPDVRRRLAQAGRLPS